VLRGRTPDYTTVWERAIKKIHLSIDEKLDDYGSFVVLFGERKEI